MASCVNKTVDSKQLKTFKDVQKLTKPKLKELCRNLAIDLEKSFGKKAMINIVCNALNISTSSSTSGSGSGSGCDRKLNTDLPSISYLQKLTSWQKSLTGIPQLMEESIVKSYLIGVGYSETAVRKYKTLRSWEHKQGIHSVKVNLLPEYPKFWALRGCCNPSFSTDPEETKAMYLVMETHSSKPVFAYCTCTVGLRGDCSHVGAMLFKLCDVVAEGQQQLPPDPTCTDLPCSWSDPKGAKVEPALIEDVNFYKARIGQQPPLKKFHPSPSITEKFYGSDNLNIEMKEEMKMDLKKNILYANVGKPMPAIFYILNKEVKSFVVEPPVHELPDVMSVDDLQLVYCCEVEVSTDPEQGTETEIVSPIKEHPPSLQDIKIQADLILKKISLTHNEINNIEKTTREQRNSNEWYFQRLPRITASQCKRALFKETTSPRKAMQEIIGYKEQVTTQKMKDGINSESEIIELYSKETNNTVEKCVFFISSSHPFLGASPDGIVGTEGTLEVKKVHLHKDETLVQALKRLYIIKEVNGSLIINVNHSYYYQIQQQLFCTRRKWADFVASDGNNLFVRRIEYSQDFWDQNLPRLEHFYHNVLLLELAYPRVRYGLERIGKHDITYSSLLPPDRHRA